MVLFSMNSPALSYLGQLGSKMGRGAVILSCFCCAASFAMDFSAPLQNVQASVNGSIVNYKVLDPGRGLVSGSTNMGPVYISPLTTNGGIVTWLAGNTVFYEIY